MIESGTQAELRLLVGSDLHGAQRGLRWFCQQAEAVKPDILAFLGDFTTGGPLSFIREAVNSFRGLAPTCLVVPGNWDPREAVVELDIAAYDDIKHLHKRAVFVHGYVFAGLGGSTTTPIGTTPLEAPDQGFADPLIPLMPADVWVLHSPIKGYCDSVGRGVHVGSQSLLDLWKQQTPAPLLVLSGHIHEAAGIQDSQSTTFVNPGSLADLSAAQVSMVGREVKAELVGG